MPAGVPRSLAVEGVAAVLAGALGEGDVDLAEDGGGVDRGGVTGEVGGDDRDAGGVLVLQAVAQHVEEAERVAGRERVLVVAGAGGGRAELAVDHAVPGFLDGLVGGEEGALVDGVGGEGDVADGEGGVDDVDGGGVVAGCLGGQLVAALLEGEAELAEVLGPDAAGGGPGRGALAAVLVVDGELEVVAHPLGEGAVDRGLHGDRGGGVGGGEEGGDGDVVLALGRGVAGLDERLQGGLGVGAAQGGQLGRGADGVEVDDGGAAAGVVGAGRGRGELGGGSGAGAGLVAVVGAGCGVWGS